MKKKISPKYEQFQVIQESAATENWNTYLELQVKLFAQKEFELFASKGLSKECTHILDVGCGPGIYSLALRRW